MCCMWCLVSGRTSIASTLSRIVPYRTCSRRSTAYHKLSYACDAVLSIAVGKALGLNSVEDDRAPDNGPARPCHKPPCKPPLPPHLPPPPPRPLSARLTVLVPDARGVDAMPPSAASAPPLPHHVSPPPPHPCPVKAPPSATHCVGARGAC